MLVGSSQSLNKIVATRDALVFPVLLLLVCSRQYLDQALGVGIAEVPIKQVFYQLVRTMTW